MGKQKRNRRKPNKENPTGIPSIKDFEESREEMDEEDEDSVLHRVHGQLESPNIEERLSALRNLESISCEREQALKIVKSGITKIIGPLLVDPHTSVRAASASALRRIAENGGDEAYESLYQDDVMTPLTALLKKYYIDWQPTSTGRQKGGGVNEEKETLIEGITLLWSLCENNECVIKLSNDEKLVSLLVKFLDYKIYERVVSLVAAQCMLTLSEDNPSALLELKEHENTLLSLLKLEPKTERESIETVPLKILASGLLINIYSSFDMETETTGIMCKVTSVIGETLAIDEKNIILELSSMLPMEKTNLSRNAKLKLQAAKQILSAQQLALEMFANLFSEEQDDQSDSELDDSDNPEYRAINERMDADDDDAAVDDSINDKTCKLQSNLPMALIEVITSCGLIKHVREKALAPDESVRKELIGHADSKCVEKQIHTIRCRAFICLNNLMASLDVDTLGGVDQLYRLWLEIGSTVFNDCDPSDIELLESATAAMRAAVQKLAEVRANNFQQMTIADIEPMLNGERQSTNTNIRINLIRMLGNLALIISGSGEYSELVKHVSLALLDICTKETQVWVMAEALDAIMDIFAEDETDRMAKDIKLVEKLKFFVPVLRNKIRQQRNKLGDHTSVVSTVKTNLSPFIKYKERQLANIG